jgi:hypothetical protein
MKGRRTGLYGTKRPITLATAAAALLLTATQATTSTASTSAVNATAADCRIDAGGASSTGDHLSHLFMSSRPVTRQDQLRARGVFAPGQVRLSTDFQVRPGRGVQVMSGQVVIGSGLYTLHYPVFDGQDRPYEVIIDRVGGGWDRFAGLTSSRPVASEPATATQRLYGLRDDGTLYRWTITGTAYRSASYPGFAGVKAMTLLSRTSTYDTLLMTMRNGALYTVHIPLTTPMRPVLKVVRSSTWQGFETLMASRCGQYGTLLLGIDKDTGSGYLYAVGHANGTATVIQSIGKVPGTLADAVAFRWTQQAEQPLFGE